MNLYKKTSKVLNFGGFLNFSGPYGTIYEPFYARLKETFSNKSSLINTYSNPKIHQNNT